MIARPICCLCPRVAVVIDTPRQRSLYEQDRPYCAAHVPPRPEITHERVRLDSTRTAGSER